MKRIMKKIGFICLAAVLLVAGYLACYFELGDKVAQLLLTTIAK